MESERLGFSEHPPLGNLVCLAGQVRFLGVNSVRDSKSLNRGNGDSWLRWESDKTSIPPPPPPPECVADGSQDFFFNEKKKWIKITLENVRKEQKNVNKEQNTVALTHCF